MAKDPYGWAQGQCSVYQTFIGWPRGAGRQGFYGGGGSQSWSGGSTQGALIAQSWSGGVTV